MAAERGCAERADQRARHQDCRADSDRLQLPRLHDPAALRRPGPHRSPHARGQQGPRRQPSAHLPAGDTAVGRARYRSRCHVDVHPDVRRLRHRNVARRHVGQHDRGDDRQPVPPRPELATRLGHGRADDRRSSAGAGGRRHHRAGCAVDPSSPSPHRDCRSHYDRRRVSHAEGESRTTRRRQDRHGHLGDDRPDVPVHPDPAGHPPLVQPWWLVHRLGPSLQHQVVGCAVQRPQDVERDPRVLHRRRAGRG